MKKQSISNNLRREIITEHAKLVQQEYKQNLEAFKKVQNTPIIFG